MSQEMIQHKATLIQPNKVTNARYSYSAVQENVLTCMIEAIQKHMTNEKPIQTDLFGHPCIVLKASDVANGSNKYHVLEQLRDLRKKDIDFEYLDEKGRTVDVNTGLISSYKTVRETDFIEVEISIWAIPFLLYWGKGVGGTIFSKTIALTLNGVYAKRMYKLCKRWEDRGGFTMGLEEFREMLALERKYPRPAQIAERVLDPARAEMDRHADISFEYSFSKVKSRSYNTINFKILSIKSAKEHENKDIWYKSVYYFICRTWPNHKDNKAQIITDLIAQSLADLRKAYEKFTKLDDQFSSGEKNVSDLVKLTKHILKTDFNIHEEKGTIQKK